MCAAGMQTTVEGVVGQALGVRFASLHGDVRAKARHQARPRRARLPAGLHHFQGDNNEVGKGCGRDHRDACPSITDPDDSDIMRSAGGAE